MPTRADFPARPASRAQHGPISAFDWRHEGRRLRSAAAAYLGVAHPCRFEVEPASLFDLVFPERR